jgi:acylphosphatase
MKTYRFLIKGRVQGVWYKEFVLDMARIFSLQGYVKYLPDKCVEVVLNLEDDEVEEIISRLYEGSFYSKVKSIETQEIEFEPFLDFVVY